MSWTYSGNPASSLRDAVRFFVQDTDAADQLFADAEIDYTLTLYPSPKLCAAFLDDVLSTKFARFADKAVGDLRISYSQRAQAYADAAARLRAEAATDNLRPYAGGISISDMQTVEQNADRVKPPFRIGKDDYFPPEQSQPEDDGSGWNPP